MNKSVFGLKLMGEKKLQQFLALLLGNIVDAHCISRVGVQDKAFCDRMFQKHRMRYGRSLPALLLGQRRPCASLFTAHHFPKLVEVMKRGRMLEPLLDLFGKIVIGGMHISEFGGAERMAIAMWNLDPVKNIRKRNGRAVRHIRVPALPSVRQSYGFPILYNVG